MKSNVLNMHTIGKKLDVIRQKIGQAASQAMRNASDITLVAVSKFQDADKIVSALEAGQRVFGENRVQEATKKWQALKIQYPGIELHLIGPLQTNKVKEALAICDVIESVDRPSLVQALTKEMVKTQQRPICYVQINIGKETQKSGVMPEDVDSFMQLCKESGLAIGGVMCIPPADQDPTPYFKQLQSIAKRYHLPVISMGMSGDFEQAIACGATHVRVGTAIFGER